MSRFTPQQVVVISCGIFEPELRQLMGTGRLAVSLQCLSSMLHMNPVRLGEVLAATVDQELAAGHGVVLLYGDCCGQMCRLASRPGVVRVPGINCCQMLLGEKLYRRLRAEGAFFLIPQWAERWEEVFREQLGLEEAVARDLMRQMHRRLIYLDTAVKPVPHQTLAECSDYCGLPYEVLPTSLEELARVVEQAIVRLGSGEGS